VLTQFSDPASTRRSTLAGYVSVARVYAAGRLDADSEGLLLLTDDGPLKHRLLNPRFGHRRTYWVQVEGDPSDSDLAPLRAGVLVQGERTRPAEVSCIAPPPVWERQPPVRFRASIPVTWISLTLTEGRNRQVRRMTAAIGFPTLRLVRYSMEHLTIDGLAPGQWRDLHEDELRALIRKVDADGPHRARGALPSTPTGNPRRGRRSPW